MNYRSAIIALALLLGPNVSYAEQSALIFAKQIDSHLLSSARSALASENQIPPMGYTYETAAVDMSVGSLKFSVPANFMPVYHPNLYIEATFPGILPVSPNNSKCFQHQDTCPNLVRALLSDVNLRNQHLIFHDLRLDKLQYKYIDNLHLSEIISNSENDRYFFNFSEKNEILITCYVSDFLKYHGECFYFENFNKLSLQVFFRIGDLSNWESVKREVHDKISNFQAQ